jgi:hypothetical protein
MGALLQVPCKLAQRRTIDGAGRTPSPTISTMTTTGLPPSVTDRNSARSACRRCGNHAIGVPDRLLDLCGGDPRGRVVEVVLVPLDVVEDHRRSSSALQTI